MKFARVLLYMTLGTGVSLASMYTWLGTGLDQAERRLVSRVKGYYGRYGEWPRKVEDLYGGMRQQRVGSFRAAIEGKKIEFETAGAGRVTMRINEVLPFSGRRVTIDCSNMSECERFASIHYESLLPVDAARWQ